MSLEEYAHLWTAPPGKYVLEKSIVEGEEFLLICCPDEGAVVLIDDDDVNNQVTQRMIAAGVPVING
ncbi:hypothetical protein [Streptomyces buecherae]|uniref:Uncharacterized protein n=1 Tax=Streptomyces buecherae TaxID=2763006 RepID=A0A7H8N5B0_9ACTN|nr:hypothetical protein [Streptomyces buecherae]QKW49571.1 hypothetical protein HUT08_08370 [Streptomyces buecherae]